jgi:hypothetical protein
MVVAVVADILKDVYTLCDSVGEGWIIRTYISLCWIFRLILHRVWG